MSCSWAQKSVQLTSLVLNIMLKHEFVSSVCYICKCIVNTVIACSMYDIRIVAKIIAMYWYTGVSLQA